MLKRGGILRKYLLVLLLVLVALLAACEKKPAAVVNGDVITEEAVKKQMEKSMGDHMTNGAKVDKDTLRESVVQQLIAEKLMLQGAMEEGMDVTPEEVGKEMERIKARIGSPEEFKRQLTEMSLTEEQYKEYVRQNMIKDRFIKYLAEDAPVTEEQIEEYYKTSPTPFLKPESVNVRFIESDTIEHAEALIKEIEEKGFDKAADIIAAENRAFVSNYGWTSPAAFSPEISKAMDKLGEGDYGGPYKGKSGYYIIRIKEKQAETPKTLEEARDEIRKTLEAQKKTAALAHWIAARKKTSTIVVN